MIDSIFRTGNNYHPQVFLEECKYVVKEKKMLKYIIDKIEILTKKFLVKKFLMKKILMKKMLMKKIKKIPVEENLLLRHVKNDKTFLRMFFHI